jgi:hypothetical protein
MEKATKDGITRNVLLSLFIYILPVALMFATFLITGERPWLKKNTKTVNDKSVIIKNNNNNGSND